jgi:hypothetical protein
MRIKSCTGFPPVQGIITGDPMNTAEIKKALSTDLAVFEQLHEVTANLDSVDRAMRSLDGMVGDVDSVSLDHDGDVVLVYNALVYVTFTEKSSIIHVMVGGNTIFSAEYR